MGHSNGEQSCQDSDLAGVWVDLDFKQAMNVMSSWRSGKLVSYQDSSRQAGTGKEHEVISRQSDQDLDIGGCSDFKTRLRGDRQGGKVVCKRDTARFSRVDARFSLCCNLTRKNNVESLI